MKKLLSQIVSRNLERLLEARGENSVTAGHKAKVNQKTVWNYTKADRCNPTIEKLEALAKVLNVHPSLLMIDSAFENGVPDPDAMRLIERIIKLNPKAQRQVGEFIEMWERPHKIN